jgi:hypothetical protein
MTGVKRPPRVTVARFCTVNHENIFVAKTRDSESVRARFCTSKRLMISGCAHRARRERIEETTAGQGYPAILTNADAGCRGISRIAVSAHCIVIGDDVARAPAALRQHFLKWDAVFFDVLVYSR